MSNLVKGLILLVAILAIGVGLVVWKKKTGGHETVSYNSVSKEEMELLVNDLAEKNPMAIKRLAEDPELRKKQADSLKELLAFAVAAQKEGLADKEANSQELENIRAQTVAVNYDQFVNKDKGPMPPFGFITEDQVKAFYGEQNAEQPQDDGFWAKIGLGGTADSRRQKAQGATHEEQFQNWLNGKINIMKESNPQFDEKQLTDDQKDQAKDFFAKMRIYEHEYDSKQAQLPEEFKKKTDLQVKLQQAQFLAGLYSKGLADKVKATDQEVDKYIAEHPELDPKAKKDKAVEILNRAKNGEDFAALANQFSEDPGNKNPKGEQQGGLYKDVTPGRMVKPFEDAALSLQPGQIYPDVVETDYGYHIIKLENKADSKDQNGNPTTKYDVRHILISTGYKDPENPMGREVPIKQYVRDKIEEDKEKALVDQLVAESGVTVAEDYNLPQVSDEQIQEMMKKQQGPMMMQPGGPGGEGDEDAPAAPNGKDAKTAKPDAKKPAATKK